MSCQQASRFIAANNSTALNVSNNLNVTNGITRIVAAEDPYVFTESVPNTPPVLFNAQKSRPRLNELIGGTTSATISYANIVQPQVQQQQKITTTTTPQTNGKLATIKTQASLETASSTPATSTTTLKHVTAQSLAANAAATQNKKVANVCVVRPQLQQQQQQQHQHVITSSCASLEGELKSISPPPLYTPTPSLWQTPLLIEAPQPVNHTPAPTSISPQNSPLPSSPPTLCSASAATAGNSVGQNLGSTTLSMPTTSTTPTAMAKVAPIVVHAPPSPAISPPASSTTMMMTTTMTTNSLTSCLPPSKFHNTTLAQHLQKVECLKKPKKSVQPMAIPPPPQFCEDLKGVGAGGKVHHGKTSVDHIVVDGDKTMKSCIHSESEELNEIPVNVIFRMALMPQQQQQQQQPQSPPQLNEIKSQKHTNTKIIATIPANKTISPSLATSSPPQTKSNVNRKVTTTTSPASRITNVQVISTSSRQQQLQSQQQQPSKSKQLPAAREQQNGDHQQNEIENSEPPPTPPVDNPEKPLTKIKNSKSNTTSSASTRKYMSNKTAGSSSHFSLPYFYANEALATSCNASKGAVAVVRLSHNHEDEELSADLSHLASPIDLPYCLQNYWFNSYEWRQPLVAADKVLNRSAVREERIASYKQQLRRQAMQLLSTRSLQKLPFHAARRRLVCVDRLLRKYYKQNEKGLPANVKCCSFNGCNDNSLEMATHCQKHIVLSAGKEIFLPCTAKFADNTQCRVPVFDITHDLPLCLEHARKRDAYNRLVYEQKPRKLSTNAAASIFITEAAAKGVTVAATKKQKTLTMGYKRTISVAVNQQPTQGRKRKPGTGNPVGRPLKRPKKLNEQLSNSAAVTGATTVITSTTAPTQHMPRLTSTNGLKRNGSTTSLESIASNSQHSTMSSSTSQQQQQPQFYTNMATNGSSPTAAGQTALPPPALAPLSTGFMANNSLPQHLFSFGHDNAGHHINNKHSSTISPTTEFKDFISNLTFAPQKTTASSAATVASYPTMESTDANFVNTNSNSNFTSSGMGSTTSLPTADDFLTQDMLSICENSSASSVDTGLGGLSDPELMLGGPDGDDMPLGDTHLLEEHDLANVLNSLPEDAFKELFATVHQDESDEIERAIELADKHLKTLQQTIGSELGDFLDFSDDMLMDSNDMCNVATVGAPNGILDNAGTLFNGIAAAAASASVVNMNAAAGVAVSKDIRGLVQT
ncbi:uncharacterized protein LOC106093528 [Stomoxys calcitrans]|uniref:uncharacterized protein LOC106093528 n=1 Tax=Stomoxys calcitrans TaxID=35570 RepID=UPI0027E2CD68|nr:uncharacterized protein LOC106093528 [Stomoxys calcitrans]XP_013116055.2 uncharacterized protein LOC106093528 [Stomoxys calcitrans]